MKCENCNEEHNGSYGSGRFCSSKCARAFSTKNDIPGKKQAYCSICNTEFLVDKRTPLHNVKCTTCKSKKCRICGSVISGNKSICSNEICKKHQLFPSLIKYFDFDERVIGTNKVFEEYKRVKRLLEYEYYNEKLTLYLISTKYGLSNFQQVVKIFNSLEIQTRSNADNIKLALETGRLDLPNVNTRYHSGWHETWDGKQIFYRSSYELEFAKKLDTERVEYFVEELRIRYFDSIQQKERIAIPDFYIPSKNLIIEIKSTWTLNEDEMADKIKEYNRLGYKTKLLVDDDIKKFEI